MSSKAVTNGVERVVDEDGFRTQPRGFFTKAIHVGQEPEQWNCMAVAPPIMMSSTYKQHGPDKHTGYKYSRIRNPTRDVLERCMASLENGKYGLAFSTGLGAVTAIITLLKSGDRILAERDLYGGSYVAFTKVASKMGIAVDFVDFTDLKKVEEMIKPSTKMFWVESPTNPLLKVVDIEAVCTIAHKIPEVVVVVDNTFLSPYFQRPLDLGADIVMHSLSKYMNGHSDVVMGAAIMKDEALYKQLQFLQNAAGVVPSPFDCFLVNRGLKTLAMRMERHRSNSLAVAKFLEGHPKVERVLHPGLPSHPQHELAKRQTYGHSGMIAVFIKGGLEEASVFLESLQVFTLAESLGGVESLIGSPCRMTFGSFSQEERDTLGITDGLVRMSVGVEDIEDLIEDLEQALDKI